LMVQISKGLDGSDIYKGLDAQAI